MNKVGIFALAISFVAGPALADATTPSHCIAVAGEAELLMPPHYAKIELGVITPSPLVDGTLAENSMRVARVIDAVNGPDQAAGASREARRWPCGEVRPRI